MDWFKSRTVAPGVIMATEPFVNEMYSANLYTVAGETADLQFDFGCGVVALRPFLTRTDPPGPSRQPDRPTDRPVIAVASHAHIDHIGGLHEYDIRLGHAVEAPGFATTAQAWTLKDGFRSGKYGPGLTKAPFPGHDLAAWDLTPAPLTGTLAEGDRIDLGNRVFTVLHLPGHSPGGIGLLDPVSGLFLTGDANYDDRLLDDLPGSSVDDYRATMQRLAKLDCALVLGGHGPPMERARMQSIARDYLHSRS